MKYTETQRVVVRSAQADEIMELRHAILRPGLERLEAVFAEDHDPATRHFAAVAQDDQIVGCVTLIVRSWEGRDAIQLRAMAVAQDFRGVGVGRKLLDAVEGYIKGLSPTPLLLCNARVAAIGFYERCGWTVASDVFEQPPIGPHVKLTRQL